MGDGLNVCVCNGMLCIKTMRPLGSTVLISQISSTEPRSYEPPYKLNMGAITGLEGLRGIVFLPLVPKEAVHTAREMVMEPSKEFPFRKTSVRWQIEPLEFPYVSAGVFVIEYVIPVTRQHAANLQQPAKCSVPSLDKMDGKTVHDGARETNADIRPAHSGVFGAVNCGVFSINSGKLSRFGGRTFIVLPFLHILKVIDASVVVILTGERDGVHVCRVCVGNGVTCLNINLGP